jgi:hypothetical protein
MLNYWFEDEEIEWSFELENLQEIPTVTKDSLKIMGKSGRKVFCHKKDVEEKTIPIQNIDTELIEVNILIYIFFKTKIIF